MNYVFTIYLCKIRNSCRHFISLISLLRCSSRSLFYRYLFEPDYRKHRYTEVSYLQLIWLSPKWQILKGNFYWWVIVNYCSSFFSIFPSFKYLLNNCHKPISPLFRIYRFINSSLPTNVQLFYLDYQFGILINANMWFLVHGYWILIFWQMMIMYNLIILWKSLAKYLILKFPHSDGICFVSKKRRRISNIRSEKKWGRNVFNK